MRGLQIRRHLADGDLAFFATCCVAPATIATLVAVEGHRGKLLRPQRMNLRSITTRAGHGRDEIGT
jgi:hypothetical protein